MADPLNPNAFNAYDLFAGSPASALASARAIAEQQRQQQAGALLGALGSHRAISAMGGVLGQQAGQAEQMMERAGTAQARYGQAEYDRKTALEVAKAQATGYERAIQAQIRGQYGIEQARTAGELRIRALENALRYKEDTRQDKLWTEFGNKFNPGIASARNPFGVSKGILNRVERISAIPETTPLPMLDRRDMEEIATGVASILTGSNNAARSATTALVPQTLPGGIAHVKEWLTSNPTGLEQQAFASKFLRLLQREGTIAKGNLKNTILQGAQTYSDVIQNPRNSAKAARWFKQTGLFSPDEISGLTGEVLDEPTPGPAASGGSGESDADFLKRVLGK